MLKSCLYTMPLSPQTRVSCGPPRCLSPLSPTCPISSTLRSASPSLKATPRSKPNLPTYQSPYNPPPHTRDQGLRPAAARRCDISRRTGLFTTWPMGDAGPRSRSRGEPATTMVDPGLPTAVPALSLAGSAAASSASSGTGLGARRRKATVIVGACVLYC